MKRGRPLGPTKPLRRRKGFYVAGRYQERLDRLYAKKQKLEMLEALLFTYQKQPDKNVDEINSLKRRIHEIRAQLMVTSTVEPLTKQNITR